MVIFHSYVGLLYLLKMVIFHSYVGLLYLLKMVIFHSYLGLLYLLKMVIVRSYVGLLYLLKMVIVHSELLVYQRLHWFMIFPKPDFMSKADSDLAEPRGYDWKKLHCSQLQSVKNKKKITNAWQRSAT